MSLTPQPGGDRSQEVVVAQEMLQVLGLRTFMPLVTACPGCGRTTSTFFQKLAGDIQDHIRARMPGWSREFEGGGDDGGGDGLHRQRAGREQARRHRHQPARHRRGTRGARIHRRQKGDDLAGAGIAAEFQAIVENYAHTLSATAGRRRAALTRARRSRSVASVDVPMSGLRTVRGTRDLLPEDSRRLRQIEEKACETASRYGYGEIATPIFEFTEVFTRTLGDTSDVVSKEMYTFEDRGGDSLTLRPENTAGIVRAFLSENLNTRLPLRVFYRGPMFRYERPQKVGCGSFIKWGSNCSGSPIPWRTWK